METLKKVRKKRAVRKTSKLRSKSPPNKNPSSMRKSSPSPSKKNPFILRKSPKKETLTEAKTVRRTKALRKKKTPSEDVITKLKA